MRKEIANKWVKALRSEKYKQGRGNLNIEEKFCCLGVLCELATKKGIVNKEFDEELVTSYDTYTEILPDSVRKWAGMSSQRGEFIDSKGRSISLTNLNDIGRSFKQIANIIENNWEKL